MVPENSKVIDIGTDHGFVPIYLFKAKNCSCLATDISFNSLNKAITNASKTKASIEFKRTDGLDGIALDNQIIIICGMGTNNIIKILDKHIKNDLIISSNNDEKTLKEFLINKGYSVLKEEKAPPKNQTIYYFKYMQQKNNQ